MPRALTTASLLLRTRFALSYKTRSCSAKQKRGGHVGVATGQLGWSRRPSPKIGLLALREGRRMKGKGKG
jgi:hypothetical protein